MLQEICLYNQFEGSESETVAPIVRRRILPVLDSDSDCDTTSKIETNTNVIDKKITVAEREHQVRYLIKLYPKVQSYVSGILYLTSFS